MKRVLLTIVLVTISACESGSRFSSLSNYDLQRAYRECAKGGYSGAGAQRCSNIEKECKKRKEDKGFRC